MTPTINLLYFYVRTKCVKSLKLKLGQSNHTSETVIHMKKLIIQSIITTSFFLLIVLVVVYNFIYNPLYKALEQTSLEKFVSISETSKISFDYIIQKGIENSKSISSRTMIKNKIIDYKEGVVSLEELKAYTEPKYHEGTQVLENLLYSARIVDNKIIASRGDLPVSIDLKDQVEELSYEIFEESNRVCLLVYSPIGSATVVGMDIVVFDLSKLLEEMELGDMSIDIVKEDDLIRYQDRMTVNPLISEHDSPDEIVYLNVFRELTDDLSLHISIPKDAFYNDLDLITKRSFKNLILVFALSFISINGIIILISNKRIASLDRSKERYKQDAYYDPLTGAYSRLFLNQWLKDNHSKELAYAIVFIDMNNFKEVNDRYGHSKGDEVLKEVVSAFKSEIRGNDFIVRYGGDEFIILLDYVSQESAIKIIERINKSLKVSFSYGISELKNTAEFYVVLEKVDGEMYEMKKNNKQ